MMRALKKSIFLISLAIAETLLNVTVGLSQKFQEEGKHAHVVNLFLAMRSVDNVTSHLKAMRESDTDFEAIMVRAEELTGKVKSHVPLEAPR